MPAMNIGTGRRWLSRALAVLLVILALLLLAGGVVFRGEAAWASPLVTYALVCLLAGAVWLYRKAAV